MELPHNGNQQQRRTRVVDNHPPWPCRHRRRGGEVRKERTYSGGRGRTNRGVTPENYLCCVVVSRKQLNLLWISSFFGAVIYFPEVQAILVQCLVHTVST